MAGITNSGSRRMLRSARPAIELMSATKPARRARIWLGCRRGRRSMVMRPDLLGWSVSYWMRFPVSSRNTSSSVGVRSVSSRTRTPQLVERDRHRADRGRRRRSWRSSSSSPWSSTGPTPSTASAAGVGHLADRRRCERRSGRRRPCASARSGVPSATRCPRLMMPTRSASSSASSRYCVVRKIVMPSSVVQAGAPPPTRAARLTGSSPVVGSSRNSDLGVVHERGGEVEPTLHATRVRADLAVERVADVDQARELLDPLVGLGARQAVEPPLETQQLRCRSASGRAPRPAARRRCAAAPSPARSPTSNPATDRAPAGRREQRAQHADGGGLAGAVRPEEAVDLPGWDLEVEAVDGIDAVERALQLSCRDRGCHEMGS